MSRFANITDIQPCREVYTASKTGVYGRKAIGGCFYIFGPVGVLGSCTGHAHMSKTENLGLAGPGWGPVFCDIWLPLVLVTSTHSLPVLCVGFPLAVFRFSDVLGAYKWQKHVFPPFHILTQK